MSLNDMMLLHNESKEMLKESIVAYFKAMPRKLPGATKKTDGNLSHKIWYANQDTNRIPRKRMTEVLLFRKPLFFSGLCHHVFLQLVTNVSEVHSESLFRVDIQGNVFLLLCIVTCSVIDIANSRNYWIYAGQRVSFEFRMSRVQTSVQSLIVLNGVRPSLLQLLQVQAGIAP